jgi:hypothetical protein
MKLFIHFSSTCMRVMGSLSNLQTEWLCLVISSRTLGYFGSSFGTPTPQLFSVTSVLLLPVTLVHSPNATSLLVIKQNPWRKFSFLIVGPGTITRSKRHGTKGNNNIIWWEPRGLNYGLGN